MPVLNLDDIKIGTILHPDYFPSSKYSGCPVLRSPLNIFTSVKCSFDLSQVHFKQVDDRSKLHEGIDRDLERQSMKKAANLHALVQQVEYSANLIKLHLTLNIC